MDYQNYLDGIKAIEAMPSGTKELDALRAASRSELESIWCQYLMNTHHSAAAKFRQQADKCRLEREETEKTSRIQEPGLQTIVNVKG